MRSVLGGLKNWGRSHTAWLEVTSSVCVSLVSFVLLFITLLCFTEMTIIG